MGEVILNVVAFLTPIGIVFGLIYGAEARNGAPGYGGALHQDDDDS